MRARIEESIPGRMVDEICEIQEVKEVEHDISLALESEIMHSLQPLSSRGSDADKSALRVVDPGRKSVCGHVDVNEHRNSFTSTFDTAAGDESAHRPPELPHSRPFPRSWVECIPYAKDLFKNYVLLPIVHVAGLVRHPLA